MSAAKENAPREAEFGWPGGDRPGELHFSHPVSSALSSALQAVVAPAIGPCSDIAALTPPAGAIGRYALTGADGRHWFARVSARWGEPALEQAITAFAQERGLPVNHLSAAGLTLLWGVEPLRVDLRPRLHGRHFDGTLADLRALASVLARCHRELRAFPQAARVRELAALRFAALEQTRLAMARELALGNFAFFCREESWARTRAGWLTRLIAEFQPRWDLAPASQCLHGQIHQANVLYAPGPVLVDWEEAVQTFAPVQWDLAYFVQRFCLHDAPSPAATRERLRTVREAYGAPLRDLSAAMRHVAWFSAVILVQYHQAGIENPIAEYEKFVRLEEQARSLRPLLETFSA